jgi:hypothetical protein
VTYVLLAAAVVHAILCVGFYRWYRHTGVGRFFLSRRHVHVRQSTAIAWSIALVSICLIAAVDANEWPLLGVVRASFAASFALALALGIRDVRRIEVARPAMVRRIREDAEREHWLTSVWWWRIGLVCAAAAPFAKKTTPFPFLLMMPLALKLAYAALNGLSRTLFGHQFVPVVRGMDPLAIRGTDVLLTFLLWMLCAALVFGTVLATSWLGVPLIVKTVSTR